MRRSPFGGPGAAERAAATQLSDTNRPSDQVSRAGRIVWEPDAALKRNFDVVNNVTARRAAVAAALGWVLIASSCGGDVEIEAASGDPNADVPIDHGIWNELPPAPIETRPYAISGWNGSEVLFWAGSNLRRDYAYTDGAAYDPARDSWRTLPVPGWGHPGLTGAVFEGRLYVAAKGGASRIDLSNGSDIELPHINSFIPATMVATDGAVWALGPTDYSEDQPTSVGIARSAPEDDAWVPGPIFPGAPELATLFRDELFVEQPVLSNGSKIIVWSHDGHGLVFDPAEESWRVLPALVPPDGATTGSRVTMAGSQLVVLVELDGELTGVATWDDGGWAWLGGVVDVIDFASVSIAGAPDWLVALSPHQPPVTVHLPTGDSVRHDDAPIGRVQAPSAVWTGNELIIWGGELSGSEQPDGAIWFPPDV